MKSLVDLLVDLTKNPDLGKAVEEKLEGNDHRDLKAMLNDKGYDVHEDECKKIVDNKDDLKSGRVGIAW
ncbi:MAG: hypothetical protein JEY91_14190 [Spirochaetaceae bacterium]|nr:hypothetical protein [Spirochaetaceae bacterium]